MGSERLTWDELVAFVEFAPASSAVARATDPDAWISPEVQMLREVRHGIEVLAWQKTADGQKKNPQHYPERMPLTKAEVQAHKDAQPPVPEVLPVSEMRDWLGWSNRPTG